MNKSKSEVKRKRGRPRKYATREEGRREYKQGLKNITIPAPVAELIWDCVAIKSEEIGVQLTTRQVVQMIIKDWIAEHDPDGSILETSTFNRKKQRYDVMNEETQNVYD